MAASFQVPPPEKFTFSNPEDWSKWIRRFERFLSASGLKEKGDESQVNTLIYCMGEEADDILRSFQMSEDDKKKYKPVKERFDAHFDKRKNIIYERAKFNMRRQEEGESVDDFITSLYSLVEHCNYGALQEEMIRDRLVAGVRDAALSLKLQMDSELTLEKAVSTARQSETIKKQQTVLRGEQLESKGPQVNAVRTGSRESRANSTKSEAPKRKSQSNKCTRCGRTPFHDRQGCPAKNATCRRCGKLGHYASECRTKSVQEISTEDTSDNEVFLGAIQQADSENDPWKVELYIEGCLVRFKIDTGADVTVIPKSLLSRLPSQALTPAKKALVGPNRSKLPLLGCFKAKLQKQKKETYEEVYVVPNLQTPLLGKPAIFALGLAARVDNITEPGKEPTKAFPSLFKGLGKLKTAYRIHLKEGAKPYALTTPRRVAIPLLPKVEAELKRMEKLGVIVPVEDPTEWCSGMVVVPKPNGQVRICVDLTKLNESVRRERHPLKAVDETLAQLAGAKVFTKLDANSGFWQIPLAPESQNLTTFITPFGRYCFTRMPFGINSAPEFFQREMSALLRGLEGVVCQIDDILVFGKNQQEHDENLEPVLNRLAQADLTLNLAKCQFSQKRVHFLGHIVDEHGVRPDPEKIAAIRNVREPTCVSDVRRFLGMLNQMSKFSPNLADTTKPLRDLLNKKNQWIWEEPQRRAFEEIKNALCSSPVLALFNPNRETEISADASSFGLGAVMRQKQPNQEWQPVAYISRAMTPTEQRYAQIEKEALALTWACERFSDYLIGLTFQIRTDHKPLVPLFSSKRLDELPLRIQRFRMRMMRFDFNIAHIPGKDLVTADALSRAPVSTPTENDQQKNDETQAYIDAVYSSLPATEKRIEEIKEQQQEDEVCRQLIAYCKHGWPAKEELPGPVNPYYPFAYELTVANGLLMRGSRIVVPMGMRLEILDKLHEGHLGITKCRMRAKQSVWWPGLSAQIEQMIKMCRTCCKLQSPRAQPLIPSSLPDLPWQKVAVDLLELNSTAYLLMVDYYSRFVELARLTRTTAEEVISHMKSIFARHGIPEQVMSDNGPQFTAAVYKQFASEYGFDIITSSPLFPQSNGEIERAVRTVKSLLKKSSDPYLALLSYRTAPLVHGYCPSELLMGRLLRSTLPITRNQRKPQFIDPVAVAHKDADIKQKQKINFDRRHGVHELPRLLPEQYVWIKDRQAGGAVVERTDPRSYKVKGLDGEFRRNRRHLVSYPPEETRSAEVDPEDESAKQSPGDDPFMQPNSETDNSSRVCTRSGRISRPPERFDPKWN